MTAVIFATGQTPNVSTLLTKRTATWTSLVDTGIETERSPKVEPFENGVFHVNASNPIVRMSTRDLRPTDDVCFWVEDDRERYPCRINDTCIKLHYDYLFCSIDFSKFPKHDRELIGRKFKFTYLIKDKGGFELGSIIVDSPSATTPIPGPKEKNPYEKYVVTVMTTATIVFVVIVVISGLIIHFHYRYRLEPESKSKYRLSINPSEVNYGSHDKGDGHEPVSRNESTRTTSSLPPTPLSISSVITARKFFDFHFASRPFFGHQVFDDTIDLMKDKLIPPERLKLDSIELIGEGFFGKVYSTYLVRGSSAVESTSGANEEDKVQVAIKTLKLNSNYVTSHDVNMFVKEALIMKDFDHPNVMSLIGLSFEPETGTPLVVLPFMSNGSLINRLRDDNVSLKVIDLINFGLEISNGMSYLEKIKFVHRDLAAKNCMLDHNLQVKIADFGLARDIYENGLYVPSNSIPLPLKWMAPESLTSMSFTSKSDVWSFGVTFWEIMTRGATPYNDVMSRFLLDYLKDGKRLNQPSVCPDEIYEILQNCWSWDPQDRPSFCDLTDRIEEAIRSIQRSSMNLTLNTEVAHIYYNF